MFQNGQIKNPSKAKLTIKTPTFIGAGSNFKLTKNEYHYDVKKELLYVYDKMKLIELLKDKKYEGKNSVNDFLKTINFRDFEKLSAYTSKIAKQEKNKTINEVMKFSRTCGDEVYICGSSLKGAVKTSLLIYEICKNNAFKNYLKNKNRFNFSIIESFDKNFYKKFCSFSITDSFNTYDNSVLTIHQKVDLTSHKAGKPNKISTFRECVNVGVEFDFEIKLGEYEKKEFLEALSYSMQKQKKYFELISKNYSRTIPEEANINIGGGGGMLTKLIIYEIYGVDEATKQLQKTILYNNKQARKHKHGRYGERISPRTIKLADNLPVGYCQLEVF